MSIILTPAALISNSWKCKPRPYTLYAVKMGNYRAVNGTGTLIFNGILLGLGAAAPIGPVNVEIARRCLRGGFAAGAALGAGAVTVDMLYSVLAVLGVRRLASYPLVYWPVAAAGVALLAYMGVSSLLNARQVARQALNTNPPLPSARGGYITGLLMTATNPMTLVFWFTVIATVAADRPASAIPFLALGVVIGAGAWVIGFCSVLSFAGRFKQPWWMIAADEFGGATLIGLAGAALLRALRGPL